MKKRIWRWLFLFCAVLYCAILWYSELCLQDDPLSERNDAYFEKPVQFGDSAKNSAASGHGGICVQAGL
ncbi:MAG: hypothetical protein ACE14T_02050 [Syntrophales bacterium]